MTSGKLGKAALVANQWTLLYKVPQGNEAVFNINVVNPNQLTAKVNIAITDPGSNNVAASDYIEAGQALPPGGGVLERTGIVCREGESVYAFSDTPDVVVRLHGFEDLV